MRVRRIMNKRVLRAAARQPLREVLEAMHKAGERGAVLCEGDAPVATLGERDALELLLGAAGSDALQLPAIEAAGAPLRTLPASASVDEALTLLLDEDRDLVPVVDENDTLLGALTLRDLVAVGARTRRAWGL